MLVDGSDEKIREIEKRADDARLILERLDAAEPELRARLLELQSDERRARLGEFAVVYEQRAGELDAAMAHLLGVYDAYQVIVDQITIAGFDTEAQSFVTAPPYLNGGLGVTLDTLELFRRRRERLAEMAARKAAGAPQNPRPAPAPVIAKPRPTPIPPARVQVNRNPIKADGVAPFGFSKITPLRPGIEIEGKRYVIGDEIIVENEIADRLLRTGGVDLVALGEIERAAE